MSSSMLEQAVIDASLLKEAALKNAESLILEKYSSEIKEAINTLLEKDLTDLDDEENTDPLGGNQGTVGGAADPGQPDPMAALGNDLNGGETGPEDPLAKNLNMAALNGEKACPCPDDEEEVEIDFDQLLQQANQDEPPITGTTNPLEPGKEGAITETLEPANQDIVPSQQEPGQNDGIKIPAQFGPELHQFHMSMDDPVYKVGSLAYVGKPVTPELVSQALENLQKLESQIEDPRDKEQLENLIGQMEVFSQQSTDSEDASHRMPEGNKVFEADLDEDIIENLLEMLTVDIKNVEQGHALRATAPQKKEAVDIALAREQDDKVAEENKDLRKAIAKLEEQIKSLNFENNKVKSIAQIASKKLNEMNLENAKLHYTNRVLKSDSLNERQKVKLVETLSKVGSVNEAKIVFESLQTVNSGKGEKLPQTLTESINKGNALTLKTKTTTAISPEKERMQRLAGIKTNR